MDDYKFSDVSCFCRFLLPESLKSLSQKGTKGAGSEVINDLQFVGTVDILRTQTCQPQASLRSRNGALK